MREKDFGFGSRAAKTIGPGRYAYQNGFDFYMARWKMNFRSNQTHANFVIHMHLTEIVLYGYNFFRRDVFAFQLQNHFLQSVRISTPCRLQTREN